MIQMSSMKITLCITNVWGLRDPYEWFKTWSNNGCLHSKIKKPDSDSKKKKIVLYYKSYEVYYGKNLSQVLKHM